MNCKRAKQELALSAGNDLDPRRVAVAYRDRRRSERRKRSAVDVIEDLIPGLRAKVVAVL